MALPLPGIHTPPLPALPQRAVTSNSLDGFRLPPPTRAGTPRTVNSVCHSAADHKCTEVRWGRLPSQHISRKTDGSTGVCRTIGFLVFAMIVALKLAKDVTRSHDAKNLNHKSDIIYLVGQLVVGRRRSGKVNTHGPILADLRQANAIDDREPSSQFGFRSFFRCESLLESY